MGFFETLKNHLQELFFSFLMCAFYLVGFFVTFIFFNCVSGLLSFMAHFYMGSNSYYIGRDLGEPKASVA